MGWWRGRLASLASRGETSGPRVAECHRALKFHEFERKLQWAAREGFITREFGIAIAEVAAVSARRAQESGPVSAAGSATVGGGVADQPPAALSSTAAVAVAT